MKNKNIKIILIIVIVILMIVGIIGLVLKLKDGKSDLKDIAKTTLSDYKGISEEDSSNYTNSFDVCYNELTNGFNYYVKNDECSNYVTIKSETERVRVISAYNDKYIFYIDNYESDGKVKVYDNGNKKTYVINIPSNYDYYNVAINYDSGELLGIVYRDGMHGLVSFYSFDTDKVLYDKKYNNIYFRDNYLVGDIYNCYQEECKFERIELLDSKNEKVIISETKNSDDESINLNIIKNGNYSYAVLESSTEESIYNLYKKIYTLDGKIVVDLSGLEKFSSHVSVSNDGNIYIVNGTNLEIYDSTGNLVKTQSYDGLLGVLNEYIIIEKNNQFVVTTIDGEETVISDINSREVNNYYLMDGEIYITVLDSSVNLDDVWRQHEQSDVCYTRDYLRSDNVGYAYIYNINTKEIKKNYEYFGGC